MAVGRNNERKQGPAACSRALTPPGSAYALILPGLSAPPLPAVLAVPRLLVR